MEGKATCCAGRVPVARQDLIRLLLVIHPIVVGHVFVGGLDRNDAVLHQSPRLQHAHRCMVPSRWTLHKDRKSEG